MLTPEYIEKMTEGAEMIASRLHNIILKQIIRRLTARMESGKFYMTSYDRYQINVLQESGIMLSDIQKTIAMVTKVGEDEIMKTLEAAGIESLYYDDKIYQQAGLIDKAVKGNISPYMLRVFERGYDATRGTWRNLTRTVAYSGQQAFVSACDNAYMKTQSGSMSYTQAIMEAIMNLAHSGVTLTRRDGKKDTVEAATLRCVRTGVSQTCAEVTEKRMDEVGCDLVLVSAHLGARPTHYVWQGKVYSRGGKNSKYPDFVESTGYGEADGLCGINCRHSFSPWAEGMTNPFEKFDEKENKERYDLEQKQRAKERKIRSLKKEAHSLKEALDNCPKGPEKEKLQAKYTDVCMRLKEANTDYREFCQANNLRPLEERLKVAEWNREDTRASIKATKVENLAKNQFADAKNLKIHEGRQNKHIEGTNEYKTYKEHFDQKGQYGPAKLEISKEKAQEMVDKFHGSGIINGKYPNKECVTVNDEIIGTSVNKKTGKEVKTSVFEIHYSKDGTHIVPAYPSKRRRKP